MIHTVLFVYICFPIYLPIPGKSDRDNAHIPDYIWRWLECSIAAKARSRNVPARKKCFRRVSVSKNHRCCRRWLHPEDHDPIDNSRVGCRQTIFLIFSRRVHLRDGDFARPYFFFLPTKYCLLWHFRIGGDTDICRLPKAIRHSQ